MTSFKGVTVASGFALGRVYLQGWDAAEGYASRIPSDQVENELNRLREALSRSCDQIEKIRKDLGKPRPDRNGGPSSGHGALFPDVVPFGVGPAAAAFAGLPV